jgi:general secretion pathway protein J
MNRLVRNEKGFTLLEVLMALAIFTIIGIATVKQISQIQETKNIAFRDLATYSGTRAAVSMIRYDLSQAFHIQYDQLDATTRAAVAQGQPAAHSLFDGRKKELIFTSLSHRNYYADKRESEQTEISYFLQDRRGSKLATLMKRESDMIDADLYQGGEIYSLLDGVETMEFQYWDEKQGKWVDEWNSDGGTTRDRFPQGVKLKLVVRDDQNRALTVNTIFKIAFTNNEAQLANFQ